MKISTRGHYGLLAMVELAKHHGQGPLSLSDIAETGGLPLAYLEQLFGNLRQAGLVEGTRGVRGGYKLTRSPQEITVGEVVRVLEGPIGPVDCVLEGESADCCTRSTTCSIKDMWVRVHEGILEVLDSTSLADFKDSPEGSAGR
ncbi:MAG: RrF2 family transcriptional regulator [Chloroflexota bacterium]|jgi:Rrf2 family cysteine metabolism transcriptional repressor